MKKSDFFYLILFVVVIAALSFVPWGKTDWPSPPAWTIAPGVAVFGLLFKFLTDNFWTNPKEKERMDRERRDRKLKKRKKEIDEDLRFIKGVRDENAQLKESLREYAEEMAELREELRQFKSFFERVATIFEMGKENCPVENDGGHCKIIEAVSGLIESQKEEKRGYA